MKIGGFALNLKCAQLKKCLKKAPALNLKFRPNRLQPAAICHNCIFSIFPPTRIGAIRRNIVKIGENLNSSIALPISFFLIETSQTRRGRHYRL